MPIRWHLNRLAKNRDRSVDQALAAALPTAEVSVRPAIARLLLDRRDSAAAILIERFDLLDPDLQAEVTLRIDDLHAACREAARRRGTPGPRHVIELIRQTRSTKLVYLVAEQLRTGPVELRRAAAQCLLELTAHVVASELSVASCQLRVEETPSGSTEPPRPQGPQATELPPSSPSPNSKPETRSSILPSPALADLQAAVEEAVLLYRHHHQPTVLLAFAMLLPELGTRSLSALSDPRQPAVEGLRQLILDAHEPAIIRHLFRWMTMPTLTKVAAAALPRVCRAGRLHLCLDQGELLKLAPTRLAISKLTEPAALLPEDAELHAMPDQAARWLPHWIAALPLDEHTRIAQLGRLSSTSQLPLRRAAAEQLIKLTPSAPSAADALHQAIASFCNDSDEHLAATALEHLLASTWDGLHRHLLHLSQNATHAAIRDLAADHIAPIGFAGLWRSWPRLTAPQRVSAAAPLLRLGDRFHRLLDERLQHSDPAMQLRAIDMIAQLNQGTLFEDALLPLARSDDPKLTASAVRALASTDSLAATATLESALTHPDARVRANAIEALGHRRLRTHLSRLREIATHDAGRPRANAIAQLIRTGDTEAAPRLRDMLADIASRHRASALWVVEHTGRIESVGQVAEMAISDADATVRQRAATTLRGLLAQMSPSTRPPVSPIQKPGSLVPAETITAS